ncbi:MAG TPA: UPF0149 family protein [Gammaproteobacteria bacterium]|nr:UPF0149 family protein [Gammaproteobacteria bacterium]
MDAFDTSLLPDDMNAAERARCHGVLTGFVCVVPDMEQAAHRTETLVPGTDPHVLMEWAKSIRGELQASDFSFRLYLPGDDEPLPRRMEALSSWSREFISALGEAGERLGKLGDDARDTLRELAVIGEGANVGEDDEEAEELMFAELSEHVRLSALFLYQALNPPAAPVAQ